MRLKQKVALLLTGIMMFGTVGIMNPTEAKAAGATNTFTLTVPADTNITAIGWNNIGNVGVSNVSIEDGKKISVSIDNGATGRTLKKTGETSKTVGYEVKKGTLASNEAFGTSLDFTGNDTQALGAVVADFSTAEVGTYEDTINFTAELKNAGATLADVMTTGAKCKLSVWQTVENAMMEFTYEKKDTGFEVVDVTLGGNTIKSQLGSMCNSQVVDDHTIKFGINDNFDLTINVSNGTYTFRDAGFGMFGYRSFAVQPAGATEFTDITLTPAS